MPVSFLPFNQTYDLLWLAAALGLAILTIYAAPGMAARVSAAQGAARFAWAVGAVSALGIGLWVASFTVLVARQFGFPSLYQVNLTVTGLALTLAGAILSLWLATQRQMGRGRWLAGSAVVAAVLLSGGLITILSLRGSAVISFQPGLVAAGLILTLLSLAGLLHFMFRFQAGAFTGSQWRRLGVAALLGLALTVALWLSVSAVAAAPMPTPAETAGVVAIGRQWTNTVAAALLVLGIWLAVSGVSWRASRLTYPQKFLLVSGLFLLPLVVVLSLSLIDIADRRDKYGVREQYGALYLRPAQNLLDDVRQQQSLWSVGAHTVALRQVEARIVGHFGQLAQLDARYGDLLQTTGRRQDLQARWERLRAAAPQMEPEARDTEFTALAADVRGLISWVGDTSYLILDPALDTYYMMDAVLLKLPESQDLLWQLRQGAAATPARDPAQTAELLALTGRLRALTAALPGTYAISFENDPTDTLRKLTERPLAEAVTAMDAFADLLEADLINAGAPGARGPALEAAAEAALAANRNLYQVTSKALEFGVQRRVGLQTTSILLYVIFAATLVSIGVFAGLGTMRAISRPLRELDTATRRLAAGDMAARVPVIGQDEMARVSAAFNDMVARLQATTGALEVRTRDLALVAEISQILSRERDLSTLLAQAVDLIRARFGLYHAQVYLADPAGQTLLLQASTGEAGHELLRRGHRLPLDLNSLNGAAAATRQTIIIANTRSHPGFRPNALLPDTRSEMVVPLIADDRVLGVLDLQSERVGGLSAENEFAFNALAGQLASAIEGSQLFTQLEQARVELVAQTHRLTRSGWQEFLDGLQRAERLEQTFVRMEADDPNPSVLKLPLEVSGETLGAVTVECEAGRAWTPDEVELVQAVARQAAQQMENLRLLAQAEQYRAEAEQAVRRLTLEGWKAFQQDRAELEAGFVYTGDQVQPAGQQAPAETPVFQHTLAIGDMPIGAVEIAGDVDETVAGLVGAVADRLSRHLETLRLSEQSQQRAQEMELLSRIGQALISQPDLAGLLRVAGDTILSAFGADQGYIALYSADEDRLEFPYYRVNGEYLTPPPAPLVDGANAIIVRSGQPLLINPAGDQRLVEPGPRAWLGVPILAGQTVIGLISVQSLAREDAFGVADQRLLTTIAASLSTAIQNARLYADTQRRAEREAIINAISQKIQGAVTVQGALRIAVQELGAALKARRASVALTLGEAGPMDGNGRPAGNGQTIRVAA